MKKYKYFLIFLVIVMIVPIVLKMFRTKHTVEYKKDNYEIKEIFYKENGNHHYDFIIKNNKKEYSYTLNKNLNKIKRVINKVEEYRSGDVKCLLIRYKKIKDNSLVCLDGKKQVSNYYLKDNKDYKKIVEKINKKIKVYESSNKSVKKDNLKIYQDNILDGDNYYIWNYSGLYVINNKDINYYKILDNDIYDNVMSTATNRYYVIFENNSVKDIERVYYYDSKKKKVNMWVIPEKYKLDKDSYINGVYKDLVYVTDTKKKVQYTFNFKKEKIELVGSEEKLYIKYINYEKQLFNKSDFFMNKQYFNDIGGKSKLYHNNHYVYKMENNIFSMEMDNGTKNTLFEMDDVVEWNLVGRDLLLLKDNSIYLYNEETGLRKIITYNELRYNYLDIYKLGK